MRINTGTRSIAILAMVLAVSSTAVAGGRRGVVYVYPQQVNRSFTPIQQFPHNDALTELRLRAATGSRGLQQSIVTDTDNRLLGMEQRNNLPRVFHREFQNDRAGGLIAVAQIAAAALGVIQQIEASPTPQSGVQKADAIIAALTPLLSQLIAQNQTVVNPTPAANAAAATAVPNVPQSTVKLTEALAVLKAAIKEYKDDQAKQKVLQDAVKAALKKVADELKEAVPEEPAAGGAAPAPAPTPTPTAPPAKP